MNKWLVKWKEKRERQLIEKQKKEAEKWVTKDKEVAEHIMQKFDLSMDFDSILTYLSTLSLDKHSKRLTCWTKIIAFTSIALIIFAIAQIILVIVLS